MTPFYCTSTFVYPFAQICEISWYTFSISDKNEDPSPLRVQESNRMTFGCHTKWVPSHLEIIRCETNMTQKSHYCHQSLPSALH